MRRRNLMSSGSKLTLSEDSGTANAAANSYVTFTVNYNEVPLTDSNVTVTSSQSWATCTWTASTSTVKVTCTENSGDSDRVSVITITYDGNNVVFQLTQSCYRIITSLPYTGTSNGYKYITINTIKWAINNVGAASDGQKGNKYQWGAGANVYNSSENQYWTGTTTLPSEYDTATQVMGGNWKMPTQSNFYKIRYLEREIVKYKANGRGTAVLGLAFFDNTDPSKFLFVPITEPSYSISYLWSSTPVSGYSTMAQYLQVSPTNTNTYGASRSQGYYVRGILP